MVTCFVKKILVKLQRIHKESITTNLQRKNYNEFTRTHVYDKSTRPAFLELQRIYKGALQRIYKEIFTTNLQGNDYNEFTRTRVLQGIYQARVFHYDEFTTTISESLKIKSLTPKVSYL